MKYGLIGEKLGHSYSKFIHEKLADYHYDLIPLSKEELKDFMLRKDFSAINVTIPYKQEVIPYLDALHPLAKEIGAVNTVVNKEGKLVGYNTDFYGFTYMLTKNNINVKGKKCLILGNGGTSQTVSAVLTHLGANPVFTVSRNSTENTISYEDCYKYHKDAMIIVNTTPLGMFPNIETSPLDLTEFNQCEAAVDVIFNPLQTKFTKQAIDIGFKGITGLEMLVAQAKQAVEYFLETELEETVIDDVYKELLIEINNK